MFFKRKRFYCTFAATSTAVVGSDSYLLLRNGADFILLRNNTDQIILGYQ